MANGFTNDDFNADGTISGNAIENTPIGATTPSTGEFTQVDVDNIRFDGNTLSITDTNGNMVQKANGTGDWKVTTPGDADAIVCNSDGIVTYPLQAAFEAIAATQSNATGDGTVATVTFAGSEVVDRNGDFSSPTYTCPVTGLQLLTVQVAMNGILAGHTDSSGYFQTSNRNQIIFNADTTQNSGGAFTVSSACIADMDAADTAVIRFGVSGATKVVGFTTDSKFAGWFLG